MEYLSRAKGFAIGQYEDPEDRTSPFIVGKGYTKEEWLQMVTIRYAMNLTSFRKYVGTTVATNVSEKTVAVIMENSDQLDGVSIVEDTVRHYIDSKYFAHILGYTGKISSDELTDLNEQVVAEGGSEDAYTINDVVGKSGIESYMETTLQGTKGSEKVVVDNTGKVITILERKEAQPGADVYLTIDKDLTEAVYNIVEQKLEPVPVAARTIAGRVDSRCTSQSVHRQAGVVGQGRKAGGLAGRPGFDQGVFLKSIPIFFRLGVHARFGIQQDYQCQRV